MDAIPKIFSQVLSLEHLERTVHKVYPNLPSWFQHPSSIYAIYMVMAAILVLTLLCYYTTVEAFVYGTTRPGFRNFNWPLQLAADAIFTVLSYLILFG